MLQCTTRRTPAAAAASISSSRTAVALTRAVADPAGPPAGRARRCCRRPRRPRSARAHDSASREIARDGHRRRPARDPAVACWSPHERADVVAARRQRAGEVAAREAGGAGDEDAHRSATTVTGDRAAASGRRAPAPARSRRSRPREPSRLWSAIGSTNCRCMPRPRGSRAAKLAPDGACRRRHGRPRPAAPSACGNAPRAGLQRRGARAAPDSRSTTRCARRGTARRATAASRACASARAGTPPRRTLRSANAAVRVAGANVNAARLRASARSPATAQHLRRRVDPGHVAPRRASAIAARPVPVPTSSTVGRRAARGTRRSRAPAFRRSAAPIGPLKRSASNAPPSPGRRRRRSCSDRRATRGPSRVTRRLPPPAAGGAVRCAHACACRVQVRLVAVLRLRELPRARSPTARAGSGSVSAARMPAANPSGVAAGQDRDVVVEHLRVRQQARRDDRRGRTAGTDRSSAACSCRCCAARRARRRHRGTPGSPRRDAAPRRSTASPSPGARRLRPRRLHLIGPSARQHEPRVRPRSPRRRAPRRTADRAPGTPRTCRCRGRPARRRQPRAARGPRARTRRSAYRPSPGAFSISTGARRARSPRTTSSSCGQMTMTTRERRIDEPLHPGRRRA